MGFRIEILPIKNSHGVQDRLKPFPNRVFFFGKVPEPEDPNFRPGMVLFALIVMPVTWLLFTCFGIRSTVALYSAESNVLPTTAQQDVTVVLDISEPSEAGPGS